MLSMALMPELLSKKPRVFDMKELFTLRESETTNHRPNYLSVTSQYSTNVCFTRLVQKDIEEKTVAPDAFKFEDDVAFAFAGATLLALGNFGDWCKQSKKNSIFDDLSVLKEVKQNPGFSKVTIRNLSLRAKEYLGFIPRTTKNNNDSVAAHPSSTATTFFGTIYWEVETIIKSFDNLPEGVVAKILAKLPSNDIYHGRSICKGWDSIITTDLSFRSAFNESFNEHSLHRRRPWFLLLDTKNSSSELRPEAVFNMEADSPGAWCQMELKIPVPATTAAGSHNVVFSSGGLVCVFRSNRFIVSNPLTGSSHRLSLLSYSDGGHFVKGMAMHASTYLESPERLSYQVFVMIVKKVDNTHVLRIKTYASSTRDQGHGNWTEILQLNLDNLLLSAFNSGNIAGFTTVGREGQILLHFISRNGSTVICCDIHSRTIYQTPQFLPRHQYCKASKLVVCHGTLFAVILSGDIQQPLAATQLQIFEYSDDENMMKKNARKKWKHVTTMPRRLPEKYCHSGKDHDHAISCAGYGDYIMVSVNCAFLKFTTANYTVMFNNKEKAWVLLPPHCNSSGHEMEVHALMPDID